MTPKPDNAPEAAALPVEPLIAEAQQYFEWLREGGNEDVADVMERLCAALAAAREREARLSQTASHAEHSKAAKSHASVEHWKSAGLLVTAGVVGLVATAPAVHAALAVLATAVGINWTFRAIRER